MAGAAISGGRGAPGGLSATNDPTAIKDTASAHATPSFGTISAIAATRTRAVETLTGSNSTF